MRRFILAFCAAGALSVPGAASASDAAAPAAPFEPAEPRRFAADDGWKYKVDIVSRLNLFGYEPGKIVSEDGAGVVKGEGEDGAGEEGKFAAADADKASAEVRARFRIIGRHLHLELDAYTVVPNRILMVTLAGIEASLYAPLSERLRVGFYHHSSHNFSDRTYGGGIELNSFAVDAGIADGEFGLLGEKAGYGLRFLGRYNLKRKASPYVFTPDTQVAPSAIGQTAWRAALEFKARHPRGFADCSAVFAGPAASLASARLSCAAAAKLGEKFFGSFGEHLYAGPFLSYGHNFSRADEFGGNVFSGGLIFDLLIAENFGLRSSGAPADAVGLRPSSK